MEKQTAYISVGSNMGSKLDNCKNGLECIADSGKSTIIDISPFYKTEPVDYIKQNWFVNAVAKIETLLEPFALLDELKSIERKAGRTQDIIRFGPRVLDLDIILYNDSIIKLSGLAVPHPRMHKRRFVLQPVCDIDEKIVHPLLKKEMKWLLDSLDDSRQEIAQC